RRATCRPPRPDQPPGGDDRSRAALPQPRPLQRPDPLQSLTTLASTRSPSGASDERVGPSARALVRFLAVQARLDTAPRVEIDDSIPRVAMASVALPRVLPPGSAPA